MKTVTIQIKNTNLIEYRCNRRENYRTGKCFQKRLSRMQSRNKEIENTKNV